MWLGFWLLPVFGFQGSQLPKEDSRTSSQTPFMWLSGLSVSLQIEKSLLQFPVREHAWVEGLSQATRPEIVIHTDSLLSREQGWGRALGDGSTWGFKLEKMDAVFSVCVCFFPIEGLLKVPQVTCP